MIRLFLVLFLTQSILFSCALCAYSSPTTHVSLKVNSTKETITSIDFKWEISSDFTQQLLDIYDTNLNKKIDDSELDLIQTALTDYAKPKNFMTYISYSQEGNSKEYLNNTTSKYKTLIQNGSLFFHYTVDVNLPLKPNYKLHIYVNDNENYFMLLFNKNFLVFKNKRTIQKELLDKQNVIFTIDSQTIMPEKVEEVEVNEEEKEEEITQPTNKSLLDLFTQKIKTNLQKVQQGETHALFILFLISFGYGMVHALGPGHGKALAFSYFASHKSSVFKAFIISLSSSFIHIIGALLLVLVALFILQSLFNNFVEDSVEILTQISAVMIMLLAGYLFLNKIQHKECACCSCDSTFTKWSSEKPTTTNVLKPNFLKKDLYFVLTAGLIPCAGTVILFIYAFVLKTYLAVFLASIFISLGMAVVIFIASYLGVSIYTLSEKSHKITRILEIVSPLVMFILGALLLASVVL
jgi:nickel/cobalt transporter (NicO) family protein